jgi:hypothetical protein
MLMMVKPMRLRRMVSTDTLASSQLVTLLLRQQSHKSHVKINWYSVMTDDNNKLSILWATTCTLHDMIAATACTPHDMMNKDSASMYASSSPMTLRKECEYDTILPNLWSSDSLDIVSARLVLIKRCPCVELEEGGHSSQNHYRLCERTYETKGPRWMGNNCSCIRRNRIRHSCSNHPQ